MMAEGDKVPEHSVGNAYLGEVRVVVEDDVEPGREAALARRDRAVVLLRGARGGRLGGARDARAGVVDVLGHDVLHALLDLPDDLHEPLAVRRVALECADAFLGAVRVEGEAHERDGHQCRDEEREGYVDELPARVSKRADGWPAWLRTAL